MTNNQNTATQNFITVSFAKMFPGKLVDVVLNGDRTLRALLVFTGVVRPEETIAPESDIRVNAHKVSPDTILQDGDKIMIFGLIKGNSDGDYITVRVGMAPGAAPESVVIPPFATVAEAMAAAETETGVYDIFVNDQPADAKVTLRDGDLVILKNHPVLAPDEDVNDIHRYPSNAPMFNNDETEDNGEEETPSQKLYAAAEDATRKAKLIRKVAQACDEDMGFLYLMAEVFRS